MLTYVRRNWQVLAINLVVVMVAICILKKMGVFDLSLYDLDVDPDYEGHLENKGTRSLQGVDSMGA